MTLDFSRQREAAQDYHDKCLDYGSLHGLRPTKWPVPSRQAHPVEWQEWRAYYRAHGLRASLDLMSESKQEKTVPALSPFDFDPAWQPSQSDMLEQQPFEWPNAEMRQRMTEKWLAVRPMFAPPKPKDPSKPKSEVEILADLAAHASDPIGTTPALLKKLGFKEPQP